MMRGPNAAWDVACKAGPMPLPGDHFLQLFPFLRVRVVLPPLAWLAAITVQYPPIPAMPVTTELELGMPTGTPLVRLKRGEEEARSLHAKCG